MENSDYSCSILEEISKTDIATAIDDFGTGYSSLEYLKRFPINKLKIDKSFVDDIFTNTNDEVITNSIISLGHNLGMSVLAESVESKKQSDFLMSKSCDFAQGYYYSTPVNGNEIYKQLGKDNLAA